MVELAGVPLSDDSFWIDEFDWTPIGQTAEIDIAGGLVVEYSSGRDGRPITLRSEWIPRAALQQLEDLRDAATQNILSLTLPDGRIKSVYFRHHEGPPLEVTPIVERPDYSNAPAENPDYFNVVIKLMEVI